DLHVQLGLDLRMEPHGQTVGADGLDRLVQGDPAAVDLRVGDLLDRVRDLAGGDGAEQPALGTRVGGDDHLQRGEVRRHRPRLLEVRDLAGPAPGADGLRLGDGSLGGDAGQVAGQQVVAPVAAGHLDDVAGAAEAPDFLVQDDLHDV